MAGVAIGLSVAALTAHWLAPLLYKQSPRDPLAYGGDWCDHGGGGVRRERGAGGASRARGSESRVESGIARSQARYRWRVKRCARGSSI